MRFNPGDKCIVLPHAQSSSYPEVAAAMRGQIVTLVHYEGIICPLSDFKHMWSIAESFCGINDLAVDESVLEKLPPPKREPLGKWADCPWQPGKVTRKNDENELVMVDCAD